MPSISKEKLQSMLDQAFIAGQESGKKLGEQAMYNKLMNDQEAKRIAAVTNLLTEGGKLMSKAGWLLRSHTKQQGR